MYLAGCQTQRAGSVRPRLIHRLRRQENLAAVRIFHRCSRRKSANVDIPAIWRKRARHQTGFARDRNSVAQIAPGIFLSSGPRCRLNVAFTRWRVTYNIRSRSARRLLRLRLVCSLVNGAMRNRFVLRTSEHVLDRTPESFERSSLRSRDRYKERKDRQCPKQVQSATFHETLNITATQ
jgi:hypothetical protein